MGIQCRIIRNKEGKVSYVEAPNGNRSQLYDDAVARVGEEAALDIVLTAYTPSFTEEVKNPRIAEYRRQLIDRINSVPSASGNISVNLNGIDQILNTNTIQMVTEDLGNGESLITFKADLVTRLSMEGQTPVAPNGELSNLNQRQWEQVRTPAFLEWSNNWQDVILDENGEPKVHYHGSPADRFYEFKSGTGLEFFSPTEDVARTYMGFNQRNEGLYEVFIKSPKTLDVVNEVPSEVMDYMKKNYEKINRYLKKNGMDDLDYNPRTKQSRQLEQEQGKEWKDIPLWDRFMNSMTKNRYNWQILEYPPFVEFLRENGYTALRTLENQGNIGLFNANQIKSATENVGTFDNNSNDIRFQRNTNLEAAPVELIEGLVTKLKRTGLAKDVKITNTEGIREVLTNKGQASKFKAGINGFVLDDIVYINSDLAGLDTPVHEFGHLWNTWAKENAPHIYNRGIDLMEESGQDYINFVKEQQPDLTDEADILEEALAQAIGDSGARLAEKRAKNKFTAWLSNLWKYLISKSGILTHDVNRTLGDLNLEQFAEAVAVDLFKGNTTYSRALPVIPVTDVAAAPKVSVNKNGHALSFVQESDLVDMEAFLQKASDEQARVSFWMGDQLGRGTYKDSTGQEHYMDAGLSYALDPVNRSRGVVWASGAPQKTLQRLIDASDYVIIMSGSPQAAKLFNKAVFDVFISRVGDFTSFKNDIMPVATKPMREAIQNHESWESLRDSTDRKSLLSEVIKAEKTKNSGMKAILTERNAFIDYNTMRDGFLADNNFDINDMMLVLKVTGVGGKSEHSTYEWEVEGEVIGVADRKINAFDVLERNRREYAGDHLAPAAQQQVIAPYGIGTNRRIQFSMRTPEQAETKTIQYMDRIEKEMRDNPKQYWSVDKPSRDTVYDAALNDRIVDRDGGMAIVTDTGDIVGVFKYFHNAKGVAKKVLQEAIERGGNKLDNFDIPYLTRVYTDNGFKIASRIKFDESQAPAEWDREVHGTPDVVFMVYDPQGQLDVTEQTFDSYETAREYRDDFVREGLELNKTGATQGFFSDVVTGKSDKFKAKKAWTPLLPFSARELNFKKIYDKFKGNFDNHIATSIPTFRETQIKVGAAIRSMLAPAPTVFNAELGDVKYNYLADKNMEEKDPLYTAIDDTLFTEIAEHHAKIKDDRKNPTMVKSYRAFLDETKEQYQYLIDAGYTIEPWMGQGEPYGVDSNAVREDVINNKHLYYLRSKSATGDNSDADTADTYMPFESSGITINGDDVLMNDLFRAVHDIFGHVSANNSFSPQGELNAYKTHSVMYSDQAQKALFLETVVYNAAYRETGNYAPRKIYNIPNKFMEGINRKPLVYDIGGSEGGFVKAITEQSNGAVESINLDLNPDMRDAHNKVPVEGSEFIQEAFYEGYTDGGVTYKRHIPKKKADVVHESMVFQFIAPERKAFVKEVKKYYLREDGIALFEEKLSTKNDAVWLANENKKNEYKSMYYSQEELTQKQEEVLVGMKDNQTFREEFLEDLKGEFAFVEEYWDSGNFKGYLATNSQAKRDEFMAKLGGRIQSEYSEVKSTPKFSIGFMQTKATPKGEQVILSNVDDQVQGQGLGTAMYKKLAANRAEQGKSVVSDFNNKGAEGIWNKMSDAGVSETTDLDGGTVSRIKLTPDSFDANGEPSVGDVVQYIQSKNYEGQTLSGTEVNEVKNAMLGTEFESSDDLFKALQRGFTSNGIYNLSEGSLVASGLYSRVEARRLLDSEEAQLKAYEMMHKIKNSDTIPNVSEVDESYVTVTSEYNSLGTLRKANPFINEKNAREVLGGIKDETLFSNQAEANDMEFATKKFAELSALTKVPKIKVDGVSRVPHTNIEDLRTRLQETLTLPSDAKLINNLNYILDIPNNVWNMEFQDVRTLLTEVEKKAVDIGLDLSNLNEESYDKTPDEVKTLLNAVRNFAVLQNESTFEILLAEYVTFFDITETNNMATVDISPEVAGKTLVQTDTDLDSYTMFTTYGLLPLGNNLYQKVNNNKSLAEVMDIVYQNVAAGETVLPYTAFTGYDVTKPENAEFVRQDIENYANTLSKEIENGSLYDTDTLRKMVLFGAYFKTKLNNEKAAPTVESEIELIKNYPANAEYLTTDFIADFNKTMLREKVRNSQKYNMFYKHFDITENGIELVNTDPITMSEIQEYLTPDLVNHFKLKKQSLNIDAVNEAENDAVNEAVLRNYYTNFPKALPLYKGVYQMDNGMLITNTDPAFLRVDEGAFEYVETIGAKSFYAPLNTNLSPYKIYSASLAAPMLGDTSKYNTSQGVKADKKINNLYTKKQGEELTNEIDNC